MIMSQVIKKYGVTVSLATFRKNIYTKDYHVICV